MKKTFKVVMLSTEKASKIYLDPYKGRNLLVFTEQADFCSAKSECTNQHLYILSNDEIKEGDWCIMLDSFGNVFSNAQQYNDPKNQHLNKGLRKIVATTDKEIYFQPLEMKTWSDSSPYQIPESFIKAYIKAYNEGKPITEVDLEMKEHENPAFEYRGKPDGLYIKTRPDNTVIVHQSKMYSREEVERFILQSHIARNKMINPFDEIPKWIDENL